MSNQRKFFHQSISQIVAVGLDFLLLALAECGFSEIANSRSNLNAARSCETALNLCV